jgi:hypothetical protein
MFDAFTTIESAIDMSQIINYKYRKQALVKLSCHKTL